MEKKAMVEMISLSAEKKVSLEVNHQITEKYLSIFNTNRSMVKFQKSKLVQIFNWKKTLIGSPRRIFLLWTWDSCEGWQHLLLKIEKRMMVMHLRGRITHQSYLKLVSTIFYQIFIFSPNDSPSKAVKNVFYFI